MIIPNSDAVQFFSSDPNATLPSNNPALSDGVGTFSATFNTPGVQWIAVDDLGNGAVAKVYVNAANAASQLGFVTAPQTLTAGVASGTITIALEDASGNPVVAASPLAVSLATTSAEGSFSPASPLTMPAGASTVSFNYTDTAAGTPTLTATAAGLGSAAQQESVVAAPASQIVFAPAPSFAAGTLSQPMIATLEDAFGNPVAAGSGVTVQLSPNSTSGSFGPASPLTIPAGAASASFQYADTLAGSATLTVAAANLPPVAQQVTVLPAAASQLVFNTPAQSLSAGSTSVAIAVALEDAFGNPADASSDLAVNLSTSSAAGTFIPAAPLTIAAGASGANFQYVDTLAGTPVLTASAGGLTSAFQQETITPAAASQLLFTTPPQTLSAGSTSGTITLALEDVFGNPVNASGALTVNLSSTSVKGAFTPASTVTIPAGASTVSFQYSDTAEGSPAITATGGALASANQGETVVSGPASQMTFTTASQTLTAGSNRAQ